MLLLNQRSKVAVRQAVFKSLNSTFSINILQLDKKKCITAKTVTIQIIFIYPSHLKIIMYFWNIFLCLTCFYFYPGKLFLKISLEQSIIFYSRKTYFQQNLISSGSRVSCLELVRIKEFFGGELYSHAMPFYRVVYSKRNKHFIRLFLSFMFRHCSG